MKFETFVQPKNKEATVIETIGKLFIWDLFYRIQMFWPFNEKFDFGFWPFLEILHLLDTTDESGQLEVKVVIIF